MKSPTLASVGLFYGRVFMAAMSVDEFNALHEKMKGMGIESRSNRSLYAARLVLVDGLSHAAACEKAKITQNGLQTAVKRFERARDNIPSRSDRDAREGTEVLLARILAVCGKK